MNFLQWKILQNRGTHKPPNPVATSLQRKPCFATCFVLGLYLSAGLDSQNDIWQVSYKPCPCMCVCSFLPRELPVGWESCQKARLEMEVSGGIWVWRQGRAEGDGNIGATEREYGLWFSTGVTMGGSTFPQVEKQRWEGRLAGSGEEPLATGCPLPCLTPLLNWFHSGFLFVFLLLDFWLSHIAGWIFLPQPGIEPCPLCPLQWKHGVLTTGPPGNAPSWVFKVDSSSGLHTFHLNICGLVCPLSTFHPCRLEGPHQVLLAAFQTSLKSTVCWKLKRSKCIVYRNCQSYTYSIAKAQRKKQATEWYIKKKKKKQQQQKKQKTSAFSALELG